MFTRQRCDKACTSIPSVPSTANAGGIDTFGSIFDLRYKPALMIVLWILANFYVPPFPPFIYVYQLTLADH